MSFGRKHLGVTPQNNGLQSQPLAFHQTHDLKPAPAYQVVHADPDEFGDVDADDGKILALKIILSVCGIAALDIFLSGTELLTPVNDTYLTTMRILGSVVGATVAILIWMTQDETRLGKKIFVSLGLVLFGAALGNVIAWRAANLYEFGFSNQQYQMAYYPIKSMDYGRKFRRDELSIEPFDAGDSDIAIPEEQYETYWLNHDGYCVGVEQRRSPTGAIQMRNDGVFTLFEPAPRQIRPCS